MGIFDGEFTSVWDDGVEIVCNCEVDLDRMEIIKMDGDRWLAGNCDGYDLDTIDDVVENLLEEYVYIEDTGETYSAAADGEDVFDEYGNGILVYQV